MAYIGFTLLDHAGMTSRLRVTIPNVTTGAELTTANADLIAGAGTLAGAVLGVSDCVLEKSDLVATEVNGSTVNSTVVSCFRQAGLLVRYSDNITGSKYHVTIPGPKYSALTVLPHDEVNIAAGPMIDLVAAIERAVVSPDGNPVTVTGARIVGRSN